MTSTAVPSTDPADLLFNAGALDRFVNDSAATFTDRRGVARKTLAGHQADAAAAVLTLSAFNARGAWATGAAYALKDVVTVSGIAYACVLAHTAGGVFLTDLTAGKWTVHQGATREDLAAAGGAALVGFQHSWAGAGSRTNESKLREGAVSPYDFPVAMAVSRMAAVQAAIDSGARRVFLPGEVWEVSSGDVTNATGGLRLRSELELYGEPGTEIRQMGNTLFALNIGAWGAGSPSTDDNIRNVRIHDIKFTSELSSFREAQHAVAVIGCTNIVIERCAFTGWRGDAIYVGGTIANTGTAEDGEARHNVDIHVRYNWMDGVGKFQRNAVSVVDGQHVRIHHNYITRCSRTDMPGAIDIEPNENTYHVIRDIEIFGNGIYDIGGGTGAIAVALPGIEYETMPKGIRVERNFIDGIGVNRGLYARYNNLGTGGVPLSESMESMDIVFEGNTVSNGRFPFVFGSLKGLKARNNTFENFTHSAYCYLDPSDYLYDAEFSDNTFRYVGTNTTDTANNAALKIGNAKRLKFRGGLFVDCGRSSGGNGFAISFEAGTSSSVSIIGVSFAAPAGKMSQAVRVSGHTFTSSTNRWSNNDLRNGLVSYFQADNQIAYTPTAFGATSAGAAADYTARNATYRERDGMCEGSIEIAGTGHTGAGQMCISVPLTVAAAATGQPSQIMCSASAAGMTLSGRLVAMVNRGSNRIQLYTENNGVRTALSVQAAFDITLSFSYPVM